MFGDWDPVSDIRNAAQDLYDDTVGKDSYIGGGQGASDVKALAEGSLGYGSMLISGGTMSYDPDNNSYGWGPTAVAAWEGAKQLTGAAAAEAALETQKQALAQAKADSERLRQEQIAYRQRQDVAASNAAGGYARNYASANQASTSFYNPGDMLGT